MSSLTVEEQQKVIRIGKARYTSKREAGILAVRKDKSVCDPQTDVQAAGAELFAAKLLGAEFNEKISRHGDGGRDLTVELLDAARPLGVEVVWLGFMRNTTAPRARGNLLVNPDEPQRFSDLYLVVGGTLMKGYRVHGWTDHQTLVSRPTHDFGYGERYNMPTESLKPIGELLGRLRK